MTEEQKKQPAPRNAAERVERIVAELERLREYPWFSLYQAVLEEKEMSRLMSRVHFLFRPFEQVQEFLDSGQVKGLADTGDIKHILTKMRGSMKNPQHMMQACGTALQGVDLGVCRYMLRFCAENMEDESGMNEEIEQILAALDTVKGEIEKAELDEQVRAFCLAQIDALARALHTGKSLGSEPIEDEIWGMGIALSKLSEKLQKKIPLNFRKLVKWAVVYADKAAFAAGRINSVDKLLEHFMDT